MKLCDLLIVTIDRIFIFSYNGNHLISGTPETKISPIGEKAK